MASFHQEFKGLQREAYTKWRGASNYIANSILNEAAARGYNVAHGTTSTNPMVHLLYQGKMFPTKFPPYFEYADEVRLYLTDENFFAKRLNARRNL